MEAINHGFTKYSLNLIVSGLSKVF